MPTELILTYADIEAAAERLAKAIVLGVEKIPEGGSPIEEVVFLTFCRGGLNTSAAIVRFLPFKPVVLAMNENSPIIHPAFLFPGKNLFSCVVDDILDTGKTARRFERNPFWNQALHLFLCDKPGPHRVYTPLKYVIGRKELIPADHWAIFPWETPARSTFEEPELSPS